MIANLLFTDTELGEDISQYLLVGNPAGDFTESGEAVLQVHREQFSGEPVPQSLLHPLDCLVRTADGLIMARVGEHDSRGIHRLFGNTDQLVLEGLYIAVFGGDREGM